MLEPRVADTVALTVAINAMMTPIDLNNQTILEAGEIDDKTINRDLTAEMISLRSQCS